MRIGVFGGTFDPIHTGHLILAEQCREQCRLDEVWFVPAAIPPHKADVAISPANQRCDMIEFAISGHSAFKLSRVELERTGPSYTYLTLEQLHAEDPTRELFLLIGADSLHDFPTWRNPDRILGLATLVAVNRGDDSSSDYGHGVPANRIMHVEMPGISISSSDVRHRVSIGQSIRYMVPRSVEVYIAEHQLY